MKLTQKTFKHAEKGFSVEVIGAGKKLVTTIDIETKEEVKFNRQKFEWMVKKGVFLINEELSESV